MTSPRLTQPASGPLRPGDQLKPLRELEYIWDSDSSEAFDAVFELTSSDRMLVLAAPSKGYALVLVRNVVGYVSLFGVEHVI